MATTIVTGCTSGSTGINLVNLVAASVNAADIAANIIRDVMARGKLDIVDKGINDLQTEADRSAQHAIVSSLNSLFPGLTIIGEETLSESKEPVTGQLDTSVIDLASEKCPENLKNVPLEDVVVWVDPLDGTAEYTQGLLDHVTTLIGIAVKGKPVAGVIGQPYFNYTGLTGRTGRTVWGIEGVGAFGLKPQKLHSYKDGLVIAVTRGHPSEALTDSLAALDPKTILRLGGAGHKALWVLEGKAHIYFHPTRGCKKWDTCAADAILRTQNGLLTDILGGEIPYGRDVSHPNEAGLVASLDRQAHQHILDTIPEYVKANVKPKSTL